MDNLIEILPLVIIPLFVAIDPFWVTAIFAPYVEGKETRRILVFSTKSVLTALLVSIGFAAVGKVFFDILGITVDDFKVAGGLLLIVLSIVDLISPGRSLLADTDESSVVPLGVPLIAGPALLTTLLVLMEHYGTVPAFIALGLNMIFLWLCLANVRLIVRFLPRSLIVALSKITSVILASIAIMMIRLGLEGMLAR